MLNIPLFFKQVISIFLVFFLFSNRSFAVSEDFIHLLDTIFNEQPEQHVTQAINEISVAHQAFSDSWIAGDIDVIVHHENDALMDNENYKNWQLGVDFPLWFRAQKQAQKQISLSYANELSAQQVYLKWLAAEQLRELVWAYKSSQIEVTAARSALQKSHALLNKVRQKVAAGESPEIDFLLAKKRVLEQQNNVLHKQSDLSIAQNQFQRWTHTQELPEDISERRLSPLPMEEHPKIVYQKANMLITQAMLQKTRSSKRENPRLFLGVQNNEDRTTKNTSLMFEVAIPLGINPGFSSHMAQEKRRVYEQQALLDKVKIQLEQSIFQAQQKLAAAKQNIHFSKQQYDISKKAQAMSEQAYQLGETDIQNLLRVQQQTADAKLNYQLAMVRSKQAVAHLNQVSGHIPGVPK